MMNVDAAHNYFPPQTHPPSLPSDIHTDQLCANGTADRRSLHSGQNGAVVEPALSQSNALAQGNTPSQSNAQSNTGRFTEQWDLSRRGSSIANEYAHSNGHANGTMSSRPQSFVEGDDAVLSASRIENPGSGQSSTALQRRNTLTKKASMRRSGSLKRSSSRRSVRAGSVRSLALQAETDPDEANNIFHCPVPTSGNPTDVLANRFQAWRKLLKELIGYFRELVVFYDARIKALTKLSNASANITTPPGFLSSGGLEDAVAVVRQHNKSSLAGAQRGKEVAQEVIQSLTGLRADLQLKIKEIKNLSGDFKNSVEKEIEHTRRAVKALQEGLGQNELDSALTVGKQDPYLLRLGADRQVWKQLEEENYLHQAYLNLESSGRELETIVVGEVQKAYGAYAKTLQSEADTTLATIEELRVGPMMMPKDEEWNSFVKKDDHFVDPRISIRSFEHVHYPGRDHPSCQEVRAGLLERKGKYLRSYAAGWYVLSPTHLHEFKSADKGHAPVMSLYLPEQKLGSHSTEGSTSNKFVLKGRQTGAMHRGHTWVFRAESYDMMMAWYEAIKILTEQTPEERNNFVRNHPRSLSRSSRRSVSSDGVVDEDDDEPFAANSAINVDATTAKQDSVRRLQPPGGSFPSDMPVDPQRDSQALHSPSSLSSRGGVNSVGNVNNVGQVNSMKNHNNSSASSSNNNNNNNNNNYALAAGDATTTNTLWYRGPRRDSRAGYGNSAQTPMDEVPSHAAIVTQEAREEGVNPYKNDSWEEAEVPNGGSGEPRLMRTETGVVSHLHVPGEYPKVAAKSG